MSMIKDLLGKQSNLDNKKISVCVPCRDQVHSVFAFDLTKLLEFNRTVDLSTRLHFCMGTLIVNQREDLVEMARDAKATHILWLDSDMTFPANVAQKLLKHQLPIVAANYVTRQPPHKTVAYRKMDDYGSYLMNDYDQEPLIEVEAVGMGCMLTEISIFDNLTQPWFKIEWNEETYDHIGEDFNFCKRARELGYKIMIDNEVSMELGHLGTFSFTHNLVRRGLM